MTVEPVAVVRSTRRTTDDDHWSNVEATIELCDGVPAESLSGLDTFSHAEIVFVFDQLEPSAVVRGSRHPRENQRWPRVGIFAQRARARPNRLGTTIVRIVSCEGSRLRVRGLDAIDGTPVLDIKPVMAEFLPREPVRQPDWSTELMADYW
jgi:tRNA-Thr(GGU) m(6)t(6)A37 methyltransferase TsaA